MKIKAILILDPIWNRKQAWVKDQIGTWSLETEHYNLVKEYPHPKEIHKEALRNKVSAQREQMGPI